MKLIFAFCCVVVAFAGWHFGGQLFARMPQQEVFGVVVGAVAGVPLGLLIIAIQEGKI